MSTQLNDTPRNAGALDIASIVCAIGRTALLLAICQALALVLIGAIAIHSGVLAGNTSEGPDATTNITVALAPAGVGQNAAVPAACAAWDKAASEAIGALAGSDVAPAQIEGAKFRLRRARRNCTAGWINLACGDYLAVLSGPQPLGDGHWHKLDATKACTFELAG